MTSDLTPVTVIGLGPMGRAMAAALMRAGHRVTVWNRTPSRADELVAEGATLAPTVLLRGLNSVLTAFTFP